MALSCAILKQEFKRKNFFLTPARDEQNTGCQWSFRCSKHLYTAWRVASFLYVFVLVVIFISASWSQDTINTKNQTHPINGSYEEEPDFLRKHNVFCYLTTWTFMVLYFYLTISLWCHLQFLFLKRRDREVSSAMLQTNDSGKHDQEDVLDNADGQQTSHVAFSPIGNGEARNVREPNQISRFEKLDWVLYNIIIVTAPIVSLFYFAIFYPLIKEIFPKYTVSYLDLNIHAFNTVIIITDTFLRTIPIRILHVIYPIAYGLIYIVFSLIYWSLDPANNILYPLVLDWNNPGLTILSICSLCFIGVPFLQFMFYLLYRLRILILLRIS